MIFKCYKDWEQLPDSAASLFDQCGKESMFFTREWFEALSATALEEGQSLLLVAVVGEAGVGETSVRGVGGDESGVSETEAGKSRLLALLPLLESGNEHWKSCSHRYTALYSLLLAQDRQGDVLDCLADGLWQLPFRTLRLEPVADDDSNLQKLQAVLGSRGFECHQNFFFYNWYHLTRGQSFEEYMAARPTQLRNTIARKRRKLERERDCSIRMYRGGEVEQALADYHATYSSSWKAHEQYGTLLDALATNLAVPDWTRLAVLYIDGEPAAAQLWFVVQGKASIFRLAYDEAWKQYSPGSILTAWLMQYVIDTDGVEEIDFLTGNESYKQDWMSGRRTRSRLVLGKKREGKSESGCLRSIVKRLFSRR